MAQNELQDEVLSSADPAKEAGDTITEKRNRLKPKTVDCVTFINGNKHIK